MTPTIIDIQKTELGGAEPVTLTEAKTHLRVTFTDDDTEITALIKAARQAIENYCSISIVSKRITYIAYLTQCWDLPYGPVTGIESLQSSAVQQGSGPLLFESFTGQWDAAGDWLNVYTDGRYRVVYTAGYAIVPLDLKQAVLNQVSFLYENRGKTSDSGVCDQARVLAELYRRLIWI